jgi:hypothetical protein
MRTTLRGEVGQGIECANGYETNHSKRKNCIKTTKEGMQFLVINEQIWMTETRD